MNKLEKILELSKSKGFKNLDDECNNIRCQNKSCSECSIQEVLGLGDCALSDLAEQLLEPYEEPKKLTKRERAFCEYVQSGWIVKDDYGNAEWFEKYPARRERFWFKNVEVGAMCNIVNNLFSFIQWEDEEPYSVEELLKWEVED